jgi:hypothetical protein
VSDIRRFVESVSSRAGPIKPSRDGSVRELEGATARPTLPECLKQNDVHTVNIIAYIKSTQYGNHHAARISKAPIPAQPPSLVFYSCPSNSIPPQPSPRLSEDYEQHRKASLECASEYPLSCVGAVPRPFSSFDTHATPQRKTLTSSPSMDRWLDHRAF